MPTIDYIQKAYEARHDDPAYSFTHGWCYVFALVARQALSRARPFVAQEKKYPFHIVLQVSPGRFFDAFGYHETKEQLQAALIERLEFRPGNPWLLPFNFRAAQYQVAAGTELLAQHMGGSARKIRQELVCAAERHLDRLLLEPTIWRA